MYVLGNVSVTDQDEGSELKVFPNPAGDHLTIDVGGEALRTVAVFDAEGKQVLTQQASASGMLNVGALKLGAYILGVEYADGRWRWAKFVKSGEK